jgi:hypothetical protein
MSQKARYILLEDASKELGVQRSTMYYYLKQLKIKPEKFPLDKHTYITHQDLDKIKEAKQAAIEKKH